MENPQSPKRASLNYAILSVVARLIAAQSGVFTLWFGRRAYERSRGEMITMLYEKTLSRKVVSVISKAIIEVDSEAGVILNGGAKYTDRSRVERIQEYLMKPFRWVFNRTKGIKKDKKEDVASIGKIMNLMR